MSNQLRSIEEINIENEYKELDEIEHILLRPGHQLGNTHYKIKSLNLYKPSTNQIVYLENVGVNDGLLKLFDEIMSNAVDVHIKRNGIYHVDKIDIDINIDGTITVQDNGGIIVRKHKVTGFYLPTMIFGRLRTGSNYSDKRKGVGLNGLGAKLTNIFSTKFTVETLDGKNRYIGKWSNNMREHTENISKLVGSEIGRHHTRIEFKIDLKRFNIDQLDLATIRIMQKRCIDAAATNNGLLVNFKSNIADGKLNSTWQFKDFKEYINLYIDDDDRQMMLHYKSGDEEVIVLPKNLGYDLGFVNGAVCNQGTHIEKIYKQISKTILETLDKKNIDLITNRDIFNHCSIFCKTFLTNPDYDSQAKDELTNKLGPTTLRLSQKFLDDVSKSELIAQLEDYYNLKYIAEKKKKTRKTNRELKTLKTKKLMKCSQRSNNELWIFEGDSAQGGFRAARNPLNQAAFLLRGKVLNTISKEPESIMLNKEFFELAGALKLQFYEERKNLRNCPFDKIIITTDMDHDGAHITGLLLVFFVMFFPELIKDGRIYRALSPVMVAKKGNNKKLFYNLNDYHKANENKELVGWEIDYKKGLGGLETEEYKDMIRNPRLQQFNWSDDLIATIKIWFDKTTDTRKDIIAEEVGYFEFS